MSEYSFRVFPGIVRELKLDQTDSGLVVVEVASMTGPEPVVGDFVLKEVCLGLLPGALVTMVEAKPLQDASDNFRGTVVGVASDGCLTCGQPGSCLSGQLVAAFNLGQFDGPLSPGMRVLVNNALRE